MYRVETRLPGVVHREKFQRVMVHRAELCTEDTGLVSDKLMKLVAADRSSHLFTCRTDWNMYYKVCSFVWAFQFTVIRRSQSEQEYYALCDFPTHAFVHCTGVLRCAVCCGSKHYVITGTDFCCATNLVYYCCAQ